jgi:hypothetical protein
MPAADRPAPRRRVRRVSVASKASLGANRTEMGNGGNTVEQKRAYGGLDRVDVVQPLQSE